MMHYPNYAGYAGEPVWPAAPGGRYAPAFEPPVWPGRGDGVYRPEDGLGSESDEQYGSEYDGYATPRKPSSAWLFILGFFGLVSVLLYSMVSGRISVLSHPLNYRGLACGWDEPVRHLPYVYYPLDPKDGKKVTLMPHRPMCVQRCPDDVDVDKKAYISISEASAVSVGKSLALLSVLHSVRSPVYASEPSYTGYCVPFAPPLQAQLTDIVSRDSRGKSLLRSVAATLVAGVPACVVAAVLATSVSQIASWNFVFIPQIVANRSYAATAAITLLTGIQAALIDSQWLQLIVCAAAAAAVSAFWLMNEKQISRGELLIERLKPIYKHFQPNVGLLIGAQCVMLSIIYFVLISFCFLQTSAHADEGTPLEFTLDPNGGLKIYPLEMIAAESSRGMLWGYLQTGFVVVTGMAMLETVFNFYQALCILIAYRKINPTRELDGGEHSRPDASADNLRDEGSGMEDVLSAINCAVGSLGSIWTDSMRKLCARSLSPLVVMMGANASSWGKLLESYSYPGCLIQYLIDVSEAGEDQVHLINYHSSARAAWKRKQAALAPCGQAVGSSALASLGPKFCVFAIIFGTVNCILRVATKLNNGTTAKAPFLASLAVTVLFTYVANLGISSAASTADLTLYAADVDPENCPFAQHAFTAAEAIQSSPPQPQAGLGGAPFLTPGSLRGVQRPSVGNTPRPR